MTLQPKSDPLVLPVVPLRQTVVFPNAASPVIRDDEAAAVHPRAALR